MATRPERKKGSSRERTRAWRERMRAKGFTLKQVWVPDVNDPAFRDEIGREAEILAASPHEQEIMDWIAAVQADMDRDK